MVPSEDGTPTMNYRFGSMKAMFSGAVNANPDTQRELETFTKRELENLKIISSGKIGTSKAKLKALNAKVKAMTKKMKPKTKKKRKKRKKRRWRL